MFVCLVFESIIAFSVGLPGSTCLISIVRNLSVSYFRVTTSQTSKKMVSVELFLCCCNLSRCEFCHLSEHLGSFRIPGIERKEINRGEKYQFMKSQFIPVIKGILYMSKYGQIATLRLDILRGYDNQTREHILHMSFVLSSGWGGGSRK